MTKSPDTRLAALSDWLHHDLNLPVSAVNPASSDASFRRYFRATVGEDSFIVMDAPPTHEDVLPFVKVSRLLREAGVQAPMIHAQDIDRGFLLLCDFGNQAYLANLNEQTVELLYADAMECLLKMTKGVDVATCGLPAYDEQRLRAEMNLFSEWYLPGLLRRTVSPSQQSVLDQTWRLLIESALTQPQAFVHRDYHSRNLMITGQNNPGVLDFQDAVVGPVTYDLVSLLRDCYIAWPAEKVERWVGQYQRRLSDEGLAGGSGSGQFLRWFDWMGLQRHIKVLGIFSRLYLRDGKPGYLGDIPLTLSYVVDVCRRYEELAGFLALLEDGIIEQTYGLLGHPK